MSVTILKYILKDKVENRGYEQHVKIDMPRSAEILKIDECEGKLVAWAKVNLSLPPEIRHFVLYGDEQMMPAKHGHYCGTVQMNNQKIIFHVFDKGNIL